MQTITLDQPHTPFPDAYSCMALMLLQQERNAETAAYQALAEERATVHRRDVTLIRMRLLNDQDLCSESRALAEEWLEARPYSISAMRMVGVSYLCEERFHNGGHLFPKDAGRAAAIGERCTAAGNRLCPRWKGAGGAGAH